MRIFDAILVPGGGLTADGGVPPWVENRLERAIALGRYDTPIVALSAGTTHKPLPCDAEGRTLFESAVAARWLCERGYPAELVLTETSSYDTVGNAYFARVIHCEPAGWRRLAVITSAFHMARTEAIFRWIFALRPCAPGGELSFHAVPDVGMDAAVLAARRAKETESLPRVHGLAAQYRTLAAVHAWLFREHAAYAMGVETAPVKGNAIASY